jgi:methenyltetrahydrofolate cyclohydrolase
MPRLQDLQVSALLDAFARPDPTPGGGSASAIAGAIGASLLMMVAGLPKTRTSAEAERVALTEARAALLSVRDRLLVLADTDTEAFDAVMAAYRLTKGGEAEKAARKEAIQRALKAATEAPLETLRATAEAMRHATVVAKHGNRSAASDVGVGIALLDAAAAGAAANVRINLDSLQDDEFRNAALNDVKQLTTRLGVDLAAARGDLQ